MNKKTIITILFALVAMAGKTQIHYQIDGNTGHPDFTGTLYLYDYSAILDSIQVVNGVIILHNGTLPSVKKCALINKNGQTSVHRGRLYTRRRPFCREMVLRVGHAYER